MSELDQQTEHERLEALRTLYRGIERDDLTRSELGIVFEFIELPGELERLFGMFDALDSLDFGLLPPSSAKNLATQYEAVVQALDDILEFDPGSVQNPKSHRDALLNTAHGLYTKCYRHAAPATAYLLSRGAGLEAIRAEATKLSADLRIVAEAESERAKALGAEVETMLADAKKALEAAQAAAGSSAVAAHAEFFETEATTYEKEATVWLKRTGASALLTIVLALFAVYVSFKVELSTENVVQFAIGKLIAFSMLSYATVWCGRNYRAQQHNFVMNRHRRNALRTFRAFAEGTSDPATKDAVLVRATEAVFAAGKSGFLEKESEPSGGSTIVEVLKATRGGGGQ